MGDASETDKFLTEALAAFEQAEFHTARTALERLLSSQPENARGWLYLGICHLETSNPQMAVEAIERAVELSPGNADCHYWLGNATGTLGQLDRARACYEQAVKLDPQHAKANEFLARTGTLLVSREHYRAGLELLRDKLPPDRYLTLGLRELLHSIGLFADSPALAELRYCAQQILESNRQAALPPLSAEGWESWAEHHEQGYQGLKLMNYPRALAAYEHALGYRDDDPYAWHGLALAQAMGGDAAAAARAWLRCLDLDPEFDFTTLGRVQRHKQ